MAKHMRVISKIGEGKDKALLLEVPLDLANALSIYTDGSVDTMELLNLFSAALCQEESCPINSENLISLQERIELMLNIYDSDRAVD